MDMAVKATGGQDVPFTGDDFCSGANDDIDARLRVRIAGLANRANRTVFQSNIGFENARNIDNKGVGNDRINGAVCTRHLRLAHSITDDFSTTKFYFFSVGCKIIFNLDEKVCVG